MPHDLTARPPRSFTLPLTSRLGRRSSTDHTQCTPSLVGLLFFPALLQLFNTISMAAHTSPTAGKLSALVYLADGSECRCVLVSPTETVQTLVDKMLQVQADWDELGTRSVDPPSPPLATAILLENIGRVLRPTRGGEGAEHPIIVRSGRQPALSSPLPPPPRSQARLLFL